MVNPHFTNINERGNCQKKKKCNKEMKSNNAESEIKIVNEIIE